VSDLIIFLSPSEAFLIGLVQGEYQEHRNAIGRLNPIYHQVFGHVYESPPTFVQVLTNRLAPFIPASVLLDEGRDREPPQAAWVTVGDQEFGAAPARPFTIFRRSVQKNDDRWVSWFKIRPRERKVLIDLLLLRLRGYLELPFDRAVLFEACDSDEMSADWSLVCDLFASGRILTRLPCTEDSPKLIEAAIAPSLEGYAAEVRAGSRIGRLIAACDLFERELALLKQYGDAALFDDFDERPVLCDLDEEEVGYIQELFRIGTPECREELRRLPEPRPALPDERPDVDCLEKVRLAIEPLLDEPIIQFTSHALSTLERIHEEPTRFAFCWENGIGSKERVDGQWRPCDWWPGAYDTASLWELDDACERHRRRQILVWTAVGALLGDMAERTRAFSEEDARNIVPRNRTSFAIDDVGQLREYLPMARRILAAGPSSRGDAEAFVVKTLATSTQPLLTAAFPEVFTGRDDGIPSKLSQICRDGSKTEDERHLAGAMTFLWHNYRLSAAHQGPERRYTHCEARAVYSLYELCVELLDRITAQRAQ